MSALNALDDKKGIGLIRLWILLTAGSSFLFQTIRLIWINKYRP